MTRLRMSGSVPDAALCRVVVNAEGWAAKRPAVRSRILGQNGPFGGGSHSGAKPARRLQPGHYRIGVIDAATPHASAGLDQSRPEAGVIGQGGMGLEIRARPTLRQALDAFFCSENAAGVSNEVNRSSQLFAINYDFDLVAVEHPAYRAAGQRLRRDMADAGTRRNAAEARI